ncbi:2498_t:CDS:2, partial [Cetraspora pellucida]
FTIDSQLDNHLKMYALENKDNPNFTQQELADKFEIGQTTVADILAQSLYWLGLDEESILPFTEINKFIDSEFLVDLTNEEEMELENLITQFQNSKNPENPEYLNISTYKSIEIEKNYTIGEMPTVEDIIAEIQENESKKEPKQQIKPVTAIQTVIGLDSILGYIEQPELSLEIDIKVFSELKWI